MARKNAMKNADSSSITFNTRTKEVMADVVQDNIKEKVNAVREVVTGKSNNEIILVLQYYDYDVEKTIQGYLEDGAKAALTEWHYSGTKPVKKKRNKKKSQVSQQLDVPKSPESVSSESGSAASFMVNGDALKEPILNGELDSALTNGHVSPTPEENSITINSNTFYNSDMYKNNTSGNAEPVILSQPESKVTIPKQRKLTSGAKEKSPSPQPQRQPHGNRQRQHSGSHGHVHSHVHLEERQRTSSTSSVGDGKSGKKHVLERSAKDLHRQTVSLERLRLVFNEEVDKTYKRIKSVFDEIRSCLNARETKLIGELNTVRDTGRDTFIMRQGLAADLKVKIDRAERMNDNELAELRNDIKHFVSDRKIDEDMGRTTRFLYDDDLMKGQVSNFGEVVPVNCTYIETQHSVSTVTSDAAVAEPDHLSSQKLPTDTSHTHEDAKKGNGMPHLDSNQAHEMAELQKRLKHSLTLEGIPVETFSDKPVSVPASNSSETKPNTRRPESANARRNNRNRRRPDDRDRRDRPRQNGPNEENRPSTYSQGTAGERVILIGRGTRQQGGSGGGSRPSRGRGRGYGGRGRGSDSNQGPRNDSGNQGTISSNQGDSRPSTGGGRGSSPDKGQSPRGGSGSPRRGGNRSNRGSSNTRNHGNQGNSSPVNHGNPVNSSGGNGSKAGVNNNVNL